jgi:hypothetical protein
VQRRQLFVKYCTLFNNSITVLVLQSVQHIKVWRWSALASIGKNIEGKEDIVKR